MARQTARSFEGPPFQVHSFNDSTFIIRQSKCLHFEGPFLYLLVGQHTAFLLDSGAVPKNGAPLPIRNIVEAILSELAAAQCASAAGLRLLVGHTHSHEDHFGGDGALRQRPNSFIIGHDLNSIKSAYGITHWPQSVGTLDLGGRLLDIVPTPGHTEDHICVYDSATGILLSGDILYPGKLVINDWPDYRESAVRLAAFARQRELSYVLGAHIEMKNIPGVLYEIGTPFQPDEHVLQLSPSQLEEWANACQSLGDTPRIETHDDFVLWPSW